MRNSQELANFIKTVAKSKNISIGTMLSDCGLSINTLSSMKSGGYFPRLEAITKIADYLDTSLDYLLGRTEQDDTNKKGPSPEGNGPSLEELLDQSLIRRLCALSPDELARVDAFVQGLLANREA